FWVAVRWGWFCGGVGFLFVYIFWGLGGGFFFLFFFFLLGGGVFCVFVVFSYQVVGFLVVFFPVCFVFFYIFTVHFP
ncbi:hypothetical protein ACQWF9_28300, partial [Salmonella enterica subsp. enterica serovar Infantis]